MGQYSSHKFDNCVIEVLTQQHGSNTMNWWRKQGIESEYKEIEESIKKMNEKLKSLKSEHNNLISEHNNLIEAKELLELMNKAK